MSVDIAETIRRLRTAEVTGALTPASAAAPPGSARSRYRSAFRRWDERASVRSRPRQVLGDGGQLYFPPELVAFLAHPLVAELGADVRRRLLVHRLYQYLHFTVELESAAVVPVATDIARARYGQLLPEVMRSDAFAIATDEAWHAQVAFDLICQVRHRTGVEVLVPATPQFLSRYQSIRAGVDRADRPLLDLVFSCITETLVTATLAQLPHDERLPPAVRAVVADHADDERTHHAYFRQVLSQLWPALGAGQRRRLGPRLPELILAYLDPDVGALAQSLLSVGLDAAATEAVLRDSVVDSAQTGAVTRLAAANTIRYLQEIQALDEPATRAAFEAAELLDGPGTARKAASR